MLKKEQGRSTRFIGRRGRVFYAGLGWRGGGDIEEKY
jgi:hypothetical protein